MIGKLICWLYGHKRGQKTGVSSDKGEQFRCPRCRAVWNRKTKKAAA